MADFSETLKGLDLDALLAEGLREATRHAPVPWEPPTPADLAGILPGYEIVRLIGRGGMGAVYEARQLGLERRVAVKILPPELGANEAFAERFRREARALGRLKHAHILDVHEFGESRAGYLFFSMEFVEGGDLGSRLKSGPLKQGEALRMVKEICAALEAAHAQGVIHRDIKPSNILLTADGSVKVADFGLAIHADQPEQRITRSGVTFGTFEYAAPEQAAGTAVDPRSDLFSVGVICYELLTGTLPRGIFDPPSKVNAAVDPAMDEVVRTAMQNDPARRYQTATDFRAALNRTDGPQMRPARRVTPAIFTALALCVVGAALFHWWPGKTTHSQQVAEPTPAVTSPVLGSTIIAWGQNHFGEGTAPADLGKVQAIATGDSLTVALRTDGTVIAWGRNDSGQVIVPSGLAGVQAIAAGAYHALALKTDGTVVAWGANDAGEASVPAGLSSVQAIAAGSAFSAALKSDGTIIAWGSDANGVVSGAARRTGVKSIAAGDFHMLAVQRDGTVVVWGDDGQGRTAVPDGLTRVRSIAAGWFHNLALKEDGTVVAWGGNDDGQTNVPAGLTGVQAISAGYKHSLALKSDGTVVAWGIPGREVWGDHCGQTDVPAGLMGVKAIAAGFRHSVVLK